jgi:hypothetical protein
VKIKAQHWLRALEEGTIVEYRPHARHNWLVQFAHSYPGGGIDGDKLYFDESAFLEVAHASSTANHMIEDAPTSPERFLARTNGADAHV